MQRTKITMEAINKLFKIYNITTMEELEAILHFTAYYKIENLELRKKAKELLESLKSKYVIVENPKTKSRTIMFKKRQITESYKSCESTTYTGYFKERKDLGEFDTQMDAKIILDNLQKQKNKNTKG